MIGDSRKDIEAANNAKMDSILVYPKEHEIYYSQEELMGCTPTYKVTALDEILPILLSR
jgi:phosphoglycolate phosphatase-like HAD superfamily hydrolase